MQLSRPVAAFLSVVEPSGQSRHSVPTVLEKVPSGQVKHGVAALGDTSPASQSYSIWTGNGDPSTEAPSRRTCVKRSGRGGG